MRALHDGAGGEARVVVAMTAPTNAGAIGEAIGLARRAAVGTDEPFAPSGALKVGCAGRFVRKHALELRQRARKPQIAQVKHVDNHHRPMLARMLNILPVVGLGDNRISTVHPSE